MFIYFLGCLISLAIAVGFLKLEQDSVKVSDLGPITILTLMSWVGALLITCLGGSHLYDKLIKKHGDKELF